MEIWNRELKLDGGIRGAFLEAVSCKRPNRGVEVAGGCGERECSAEQGPRDGRKGCGTWGLTLRRLSPEQGAALEVGGYSSHPSHTLPLI